MIDNPAVSYAGRRNRHAIEDLSGMSIRTHFQPGATIVQVRGAIDGCNGSRLSEHVDGLVGSARYLILDLRGVGFFGSAGFRSLVAIAEKIRRADARWMVVAGGAVDRFLHGRRMQYRLPRTASLTEALHAQRPAGIP